MNFLDILNFRREVSEQLRAFREDLVNSLLPSSVALLVNRVRIKTISTDDTGRNALVDGVTSYTSGINGTGTTSAGRIEPAGHLIVPREDEPGLALGNLKNAAYLPLGSPKYRPKGGKGGDQASYSESETPAVLWNRESGAASWESGANARFDLSSSERRIRAKEVFHADHYAGGDISPTILPGEALGGGVPVVIGTDAAMTLSLPVLPMAPAGLLCVIIFGKGYDSEPHLGGPFPKSPQAALPPPAGLAGSIYAIVLPFAVQLLCTSPPAPGLYRFSLTVMG